jgi:hypothetical protein
MELLLSFHFGFAIYSAFSSHACAQTGLIVVVSVFLWSYHEFRGLGYLSVNSSLLYSGGIHFLITSFSLRWLWRGVTGSGRGRFKVMCRNFIGGTAKQKKPQTCRTARTACLAERSSEHGLFWLRCSGVCLPAQWLHGWTSLLRWGVNMTSLWNIAPCSLCVVVPRVRGVYYCLRHQGDRLSRFSSLYVLSCPFISFGAKRQRQRH